MSSNGTANPTRLLSDGANIQINVLAVQTALTFLIIGTVMGTLLIPIIISLVVFSTPASRRRPTFVLNVCSTVFGISMAVLNGFIEVCSFIINR